MPAWVQLYVWPSCWRPCSRSFFIAVKQALGPGGVEGDEGQPGRQRPKPPRKLAAEDRIDSDQHQERGQRQDQGQTHVPCPSHPLLRRKPHSGMLPCLRQGFSSFWVSSIA